MDNFSPNRRNVVDITDLNKFLTKMYGLMTLAVLLSALTAWLVMTVFAQQFTAFMVNNRWGMWLIILLPIHRDFTRLGSYASAALIGLIIAMLVNFFVQSPIINYLLSIVAVIIFTALTAWDAQRMKNIYTECNGQVSSNGLAVLGALQLYLDFINLFISFLDIFGSSNES